MTKTAETHAIESTLILTCFATHRWVKQFENLVIDPDLLRRAWNFYHPDQELTQASTMNPADFIHKYDPKAPTISMLTEIFPGSAIVGMVHFLKTNQTITSQSASQASANMLASFKASCLFASFTGETSVNTQMASKLASNLSSSGAQIKFDLICMGYIPTIKSTLLKQSVQQFKDFDPGTFSVTNDPNMYPDMDGVQNRVLDQGQNQTTQQSNMGSVIRATVMSLSSLEDNDNQALDVTTFMNAFDDYAKNAPGQKQTGVPIGMNVRMYAKSDVEYELAKKFFDSTNSNQAPQTNTTTAAAGGRGAGTTTSPTSTSTQQQNDDNNNDNDNDNDNQQNTNQDE